MTVRTNGSDLLVAPREPLEGQTSFFAEDERPEITIDPEFRDLLPRLRAEERARLEAKIVAEGWLDRYALVVWAETGILLDGHNRLAICEAHDIRYRVDAMSFPDRDAAKIWVIEEQIDRRNLKDIDRIDAFSKREQLIARRAKANQGTRTDLPQNSAESPPIETRVEVAKLAGVSHDTYAKGKVVLAKGDEELIEAVRRDEVSIHAARMLAELPKEEQVEAVRAGPEVALAKAKEVRKRKKAGRSGSAPSPARGGKHYKEWMVIFDEMRDLFISLRHMNWVETIVAGWPADRRDSAVAHFESFIASSEDFIRQIKELER